MKVTEELAVSTGEVESREEPLYFVILYHAAEQEEHSFAFGAVHLAPVQRFDPGPKPSRCSFCLQYILP